MTDPYYTDGHVTLYLGDCREVTEWLDADVLVTDPPYGVGWAPSGLHSRRAARAGAEPAIAGDKDTAVRDDALALWGTRPAVVFGTWRAPRPTGRIAHRLIWHKAARKPGVATAPWYPADEEIYLLGRGWVGAPHGSVLTTHEPRERQPALIGHPTPKPVGLMERLLAACPPGVVADPFAGSGSTLVAATLTGRDAVGVELEERYCEVAAKRLAQGALDFGGAA